MTNPEPARACRARKRAFCRRFAVYRVARYVFVNENPLIAHLGKGWRCASPVASPRLWTHRVPPSHLRSFTMLTSYKEV